MPLDSVAAVPDALEASFVALGVGGQVLPSPMSRAVAHPRVRKTAK